MKRCHRCHKELPENARFCLNCGAEQPSGPDPAPQRILIDTDKDVSQQFTEQFFLALKQRVSEEHDADLFQAYSERVYETTYRDTVSDFGQKLEKQVEQRRQRGKLDMKKFNQYVHHLLENQLDYFIITYCQDLNDVKLPEAILKYQDVTNWSDVNVYKMVMDYLDFDNEREKPYTDFLNMPVEKLKNAGKHFLFPARKEKILFIVDTSLMGNCKEGFAMTEHALYWKFPLQKARLVNYERLEAVKRVENWITINGLYFHVNASINLKMMKLLKKITGLRFQV